MVIIGSDFKTFKISLSSGGQFRPVNFQFLQLIGHFIIGYDFIYNDVCNTGRLANRVFIKAYAMTGFLLVLVLRIAVCNDQVRRPCYLL